MRAIIISFMVFAIGISVGHKNGREAGYDACIEAVKSYTFQTANADYNRGADAMKSAALSQIECYREDRR